MLTEAGVQHLKHREDELGLPPAVCRAQFKLEEVVDHCLFCILCCVCVCCAWVWVWVWVGCGVVCVCCGWVGGWVFCVCVCVCACGVGEHLVAVLQHKKLRNVVCM